MTVPLSLFVVVESDDSPVQVETIDDHTLTKLTLKQLDPKSRYRFYLRGRTSAGDGEPITREGATTLDGGRTAGGLELDPFFFFIVHAMWNFVIGFTHIKTDIKTFCLLVCLSQCSYIVEY